MLFSGEGAINEERTTEAASQVFIKLEDIPKCIKVGDDLYKLRGICAYHRGASKFRNSVGHYTAYYKRGGNIWELYDELKSKSIIVKESAVVPCEFVIYTL